jgi:hypothetical protein
MMRFIMIESIALERGHESTSRQIGGWRAVASAWALIGVLLLLLAGVSAVACPRSDWHPHRHLAGAVIPQHDPCTGLGVPSAPGVDGCRTVPLSQDWASYDNYW